jgi:Tfp pilus assembly protein PilO
MMHRRQKRQILFAGFLGVIAVVNLLFYLILLRPARSDYFNLQGSIDQLRSQNAAAGLQVQRLEKTSAQLERFDQDRSGLFNTHFIKYDPGFAELSPRLEQMAVMAGVRRPVVDFTRDEIKQYGLYSVKIKIPVQGTYNNAVNFIKSLETSDTFFLINSIDVKSGEDEGATATAAKSAGAVSLSLSLETFFYK